MLIVGDRETSDPASSARPVRYENLIAWIPHGSNRQVIAVGGPTQWAAPGPLPSEAVVTDLVRDSLEDPALAADLWGSFLRYVAWRADPGRWRQFSRQIFGLPVGVAIAHHPTKAAVLKALSKCRSAKLIVREG